MFIGDSFLFFNQNRLKPTNIFTINYFYSKTYKKFTSSATEVVEFAASGAVVVVVVVLLPKIRDVARTQLTSWKHSHKTPIE